MRQFFTLEELKTAKLNDPFSFTKGIPLLKIKNQADGPAIGNIGNDNMGFEDTNSALYNIKDDPGQLENIINSPQKDRLLKEMKEKMKENDAPSEVLERFEF